MKCQITSALSQPTTSHLLTFFSFFSLLNCLLSSFTYISQATSTSNRFDATQIFATTSNIHSPLQHIRHTEDVVLQGTEKSILCITERLHFFSSVCRVLRDLTFTSRKSQLKELLKLRGKN